MVMMMMSVSQTRWTMI